MIAHIEGVVLAREASAVIISVAGIGYRIYATPAWCASTSTGELAKLFIYEHIRDDAHDLFGFPTHEELSLFEQLISVNGVGPKMGLKVFAVGIQALTDAVMRADSTALSAIPGVGKKTAQKIILELRGVLDLTEDQHRTSDLVLTLVEMGIERKEALSLSQTIDPTLPLSEQVKLALKAIAR